MPVVPIIYETIIEFYSELQNYIDDPCYVSGSEPELENILSLTYNHLKKKGVLID